MTGRLLCLDVGDKRIGIAVCDERQTIAFPLCVYNRIGWGPDVRYIQSLCLQQQTQTVICGLPLSLNGTEGPQAAKTRQFAQQLEQAGLTVLFQDERLTTVSAEQVLIQGGVHRAERRQHVDKLAACIILESYLARQNAGQSEGGM